MLSIFLLTKQVLLKTIVIVVGKLIRNRVLRGGGGLCGAPKGGDGSKTKLCETGMKTTSFGPVPPYCHPYLQ